MNGAHAVKGERMKKIMRHHKPLEVVQDEIDPASWGPGSGRWSEANPWAWIVKRRM